MVILVILVVDSEPSNYSNYRGLTIALFWLWISWIILSETWFSCNQAWQWTIPYINGTFTLDGNIIYQYLSRIFQQATIDVTGDHHILKPWLVATTHPGSGHPPTHRDSRDKAAASQSRSSSATAVGNIRWIPQLLPHWARRQWTSANLSTARSVS